MMKIAVLPLVIVFSCLLVYVPTCKSSENPTFKYPNDLHKLRKTSFKHIWNTTYLDYTGAGVYMDATIEEYQRDLLTLHLNKEETVNEIRNELLSFLGADPNVYKVIFVASATQALKLVGENFPWTKDSTYAFTSINHNSVLGIRKYVNAVGGKFRAISSPKDAYDLPYDSSSSNLLAFPLEDNFAGIKYPPSDIKEMLANKTFRQNWHILGDAAAYIPTNPLNLDELDYDAVVMSFYKIFGFPNTGALVIKKSFLDFLKKKSYLANSVNYSSYTSNDFSLASFEDDEPPFVLNLALRHGLKELNNIGMHNIQRHTAALTERFYKTLDSLSHSNGVKAAEIYGNHNMGVDRQGAIVAFNLKRTPDEYFGYYQVVKEASESGFHLRGGCHCNPGACFGNMRLEESKIKKYFEAKTTCGDENDVVDGVPLGAIRASFGWASTEQDVDNFLRWLGENYVF